MKQTLTIHSWNVNGLRSVLRKGSFAQYLAHHAPDILCLQETKAHPAQIEEIFPEYHTYWSAAEKKGYSGTAIFTKILPVAVHRPETIIPSLPLIDMEGRDGQTEGRIVIAEYDGFFVVNVYTPNAKEDLSRLSYRKDQWDPYFLSLVTKLEQQKPVIFCGDLNVAAEPVDLARPKENEGKHGFTTEERDGIRRLRDAGFVDTFRYRHPHQADAYTWWSHWGRARERNVGWRIDYIFASSALLPNVIGAEIFQSTLGSDHCPVGITLTLPFEE